MGLTLYQNKKKSWKHVVIRTYSYEKNYFFNFNRVPHNRKLIRPRFHCMINLFIFSLWRDNSNFRIGVGFGKKHISLNIHN